MAIPSVSPDLFDRALAQCTRDPNNPRSDKRTWNYTYSEAFMAELPELYNLMASAVTKDPDIQVSASFALNLATVMHHAYKLAGAKYAALSRQEIIALRYTEEDWVNNLRRLPVQLAQETEEEYFVKRANGPILKIAIDMMHDFAGMHKPHNPQLWARSLEVGRMNLAAAHAALNLSVERSG
jgi:hypothetical protein